MKSLSCMRALRRTLAATIPVLAAIAIGLGTPSIAAAQSPIAPQASCVAWFTTTLGHAGVAGPVIANGAPTLSPFGQNVVSRQAAGERDECPFDPHWFLVAGDGSVKEK